MAKKTEKATKSTAKKSTKQPSKPIGAKDTLIKMAQILLPIAGIFTALSYFLGRLHIESYYYALGITPHVLDFKPEDYMFSSFNLVIMCLTISVWLYMYWGWARPGRRLILGFPVGKGSKQEIAMDIIMLAYLLILWGLLGWNILWGKGVGYSLPGFLGMNAGFFVAIGVIIWVWLMQIWLGVERLRLSSLILTGIVILASIPPLTARLAQIQAKTDIERFPQTVLICEDNLPSELQSSPSTPTKSSEVKLIITNNGMTYVLKQDGESTDEWQIYAIQDDDIKQIIYLLEK
jgi:hypothetical protein